MSIDRSGRLTVVVSYEVAFFFALHPFACPILVVHNHPDESFSILFVGQHDMVLSGGLRKNILW